MRVKIFFIIVHLFFMSPDQPVSGDFLFLIPGCASTISKQVPVCQKWYKETLSAMLFKVNEMERR